MGTCWGKFPIFRKKESGRRESTASVKDRRSERDVALFLMCISRLPVISMAVPSDALGGGVGICRHALPFTADPGATASPPRTFQSLRIRLASDQHPFLV